MTELEMMWKLTLALSVLLGIVVAIKKVFYSKTPQPFEVKTSEEYMTRRECSVSHINFDLRLTAVERRLDNHLVEVKSDIGDLHDKINENEKQNAVRHSEVMRAIGRLEATH